MPLLNWVVFGILCSIFPLVIGQDVPRSPFIRLNITLNEEKFAGIASQTLSEGHFAVFWGINGTVSFRAYKPDETRLYTTSTATFTENAQWLVNTTSLRITKGGFDYIAVTTLPPMILKYDGSTFTTKLLQLNPGEGFMSLLVQDDYFMLGTCNATEPLKYYIRYVTVDGRIERTQSSYSGGEGCVRVRMYKEFLYTSHVFSSVGYHTQYYITYFNGSTYSKDADDRTDLVDSVGDFLVLLYYERDQTLYYLSLQSTRTWQRMFLGAYKCQNFKTSSNTTHLTAICINEPITTITVIDVANFKGEASIQKYKNIPFGSHYSLLAQVFMPNNEEIGIVGFFTDGFYANMFTTVDIALPSLQFLRNITALENIPASLHQQGLKDEYLWRRNLLHAKQFKWSNHTDEVHLTKVNLSGYNITGQLPMNLFGLRYLEYLDLSHNKLSGTASDLIYSFGLSVINMSNNALTGCPPLIRSPEPSCNFSHNMLGFGIRCDNSFCDWSHQYYTIKSLELATPALWYWTPFKPSNIRSTSSSYLWNDLVVFAGDEKNKVVEFFNTTSGTWGILGNLYLARSYPSIAAVGPYLVISGGMSQIQPTGTVDIYNSLNNTWTVTHTEQPRGLHPALTIGDEIWLGGSSAIEILNPATRKWRVLENRQINGSVATTPYAIVTGFGMIYDRLNDKWSSFKGHPEAVVVAFEDTKVAVLSPGSNTLDILDTYGWIWSHKPKNASKALCGAHSEGHLVFLSSDFRKNYLELKLFNLSSEQWTGEQFPYREFTAQVTAFPNHKKQILFASTSLAVFTWKGFAPSFWPPIAPPTTVSAESPLSPSIAEGPVHSSQTPTIAEGPVQSSPQQISPTPMSPKSIVDQPHGESPASGDDSSAFVWIIVAAVIAVLVVVGLAFLWLRKRNLKSSSNKEEEEGLMDELTEQDSINNSQREFNPADILFSEISVGEKLGEGSFGEIYKAKWHGQTVVIKKMKPNMLNKSMMIEEALTLTSLHHKHIVLSMGISKNEETDSVILVMEYMKNGSLEDLIFRDKIPLTRQDIIRLALDVAKGLNYLHSLNPKIIHRDLKGANVLLYQNRKRAKISDFGTARFLNSGSSAAKTVIGTFGSIAPEILQEAPYNEKADIYSFGVLLFEMTTSTHLAVIFEEEKRIEKISNTVEDPQFKQLIINCCRTDPIERPSIRRCIEVLKQLKAK